MATFKHIVIISMKILTLVIEVSQSSKFGQRCIPIFHSVLLEILVQESIFIHLIEGRNDVIQILQESVGHLTIINEINTYDCLAERFMRDRFCPRASHQRHVELIPQADFFGVEKFMLICRCFQSINRILATENSIHEFIFSRGASIKIVGNVFSVH